MAASGNNVQVEQDWYHTTFELSDNPAPHVMGRNRSIAFPPPLERGFPIDYARSPTAGRGKRSWG